MDDVMAGPILMKDCGTLANKWQIFHGSNPVHLRFFKQSFMDELEEKEKKRGRKWGI